MSATMRPLPQLPDSSSDVDVSLGFELMAAVAKEDVTLVRKILSRSPPSERHHLANFYDYDRRTPLHLACAEGLPAIAKELLREGADPAAQDRFGVSCARDAIRHGRLETLRVLGEFSASFPGKVQPTDVDPRYALGRDLIAVVAERNVNAAQQLVRHFNANVNFANSDGRTALHIAAVRGDVPMTRYLLDAGADMHRQDRWGASALDEAQHVAAEELVDLMIKHDAARSADELTNIAQEPATFAAC